jgi:hypothetical protein
MTIYTVHLPQTGDRVADAERAVFIPDAFSWGAFLLGPLWLLGNRVWLAFLLWCGIVAALVAVSMNAAAMSSLGGLAALLVALFFGWEGRHFLRMKFDGRGYRLTDVVSARNLRDAEQSFFLRWLANPPPARANQPPLRSPSSESDVLGLFPEASEGGP